MHVVLRRCEAMVKKRRQYGNIPNILALGSRSSLVTKHCTYPQKLKPLGVLVETLTGAQGLTITSWGLERLRLQ